MSERISFEEADRRFQLSELLPAYDQDGEVVVLEPGRHGAEEVDLDQHCYVVDGDLVIDGNVMASEEGTFLVVRGTLQVHSLLIGGPIVYVDGDLRASYAIHTDYNHGVLVVRGDVNARIIAAEHLFAIGGAIHCETTIDFGGFRLSQGELVPTLTHQQAARESTHYFIPEVLNDQGYVNGAALTDVLADGRNPLLTS